MFLWWYSSGWKVFIDKLKTTFTNITDFFSMGSLLHTLFKPYRQISAEVANEQASLDIKFHIGISVRHLQNRLHAICLQ